MFDLDVKSNKITRSTRSIRSNQNSKSHAQKSKKRHSI